MRGILGVGPQAATTESDAIDIPRLPIAPISSEYSTIFRTNIDGTSQLFYKNSTWRVQISLINFLSYRVYIWIPHG